MRNSRGGGFTATIIVTAMMARATVAATGTSLCERTEQSGSPARIRVARYGGALMFLYACLSCSTSLITLSRAWLCLLSTCWLPCEAVPSPSPRGNPWPALSPRPTGLQICEATPLPSATQGGGRPACEPIARYRGPRRSYKATNRGQTVHPQAARRGAFG